MKASFSCFIAFFILTACNKPKTQALLASSSIYEGLETMGPSNRDITPDDTTDRWYHENTLTIRGDSFFLDKVPVVFHRGSKSYSSSDGGFCTYEGKIRNRGNSDTVDFTLVGHDYIAIRYIITNPADSASKLSFEEKVKRGMLVVDSSYFKSSHKVTRYPNRVVIDSVEYKLEQIKK
jgi:hypothetical protein